MTLVKLGAAALNTTPLAWDANARAIAAVIDDARAAGVSVLCLPELCITGYGAEDAFQSPSVLRTASEVLLELAPRTAGMAVAIGLPVMHRRTIYNAAAFVVDGRVAGLVGKRHLAGDGIHYEPRWFKPWPEGVRDELGLGDARVPIGDLDFDLGEVSIGFEICEDAWVANRPGAELSLAGVDIILNPSASHFAFGKQAVRERIVVEGSRAFGVAYVYANLLGNEAGRVIYDGGGLIASGGELVAAGPRLSFRDHTLTTAVVELELTRMRRARSASYAPAAGTRPVAAPLALPALAPTAPQAVERPAWEAAAALECEEFRRAVALGLYDYLRKSRARGFVVSLSGGADSAAVSCLVGEAVALAVSELGLEAARARLAHIPGLAGAETPRELVGRLLTCVYQATAHSSHTTRAAARGVAAGLGARFLALEVGDLVAGYTAKVEAALGRTPSWVEDDLALQNIQARVRGPGAWMVANLEGALLLATSNRSEAAVGYATMDGDTCGGLSPIAGIDKAFLRRWLRWLEPTLPALAAVNAQQPTAELRPAAAAQTDEADLMPYELLDAVELAAIRDKRSPLEVFRTLRPVFAAMPATELAGAIERFFRLWCRNQWKRERYAPSFHLDDENLDPKTWCRFPILSGGYERELAELAAYVETLA